ncbi:MAG: penicillin-binding protein 1A [Cellvibrionaceae bacterium]|jgi:penicillin-binding protein 1A
MEKFKINKKLLNFTIWAFFLVSMGVTAGLSGIYLLLSPNLPAIDSLKEVELQTPLRVYSIDDKLIGEFGEKRRDPISINEAPQALINAIISAEDDGFYQHNGVDIKGLLRAISQLALSGEIQSGGSTITMQVARNFFLSREQTFSRKFNEILLALKIERYLSKAEVLELYLNKIYLGNSAYGVKAAAQVYYGLTLPQLSLAQTAMIAGLPKAPSTYNPIINPSRALIRRNWILRRMASLKKITEDELLAALSEPVTARFHGQHLDIDAPYIAEAAREYALEMFGEKAYINGYKVYTTVDSQLQLRAQKSIVTGLLNYDKRHGYRGPEDQWDPTLLELLDQLENAQELGSEKLKNVNLLPWLERLKQIPNYGGLKPAVVVRIGEKQISALTALGATVDIAWENGLSEAKLFVNENFARKAPESPKDVTAIGDVIRIYQNEDQQWYFSQVPKVESALVSIDPYDGSINALAGGFDFAHSSFNRVTQAKRQPGSNFKPFIYATGFENGLSPATTLNDAPIVIEDVGLEGAWRPENSSGKFYGPTRLRKALYLSRNLISIRLLRTIGISKTIESMARFGMDTKAMPRNLSMALGSYVMSPLEVATGYSVFANGGYKIEPYLIHHIRDRNDEILFKASPLVTPDRQALSFKTTQEADLAADSPSALKLIPTDLLPLDITKQEQAASSTIVSALDGVINISEAPGVFIVDLEGRPAARVMDERVVYMMNSIMRDVVKRGTGTRAQVLGRNDLAGKTGTTNGPIDAWFSGFNDHTVTTTWVGFDDNSKLGRGEYGGISALPIWIDYMRLALADVPDTVRPQPNGIVTIRVNAETGERARLSDPNGIYELFLEENTPEELEAVEIITIDNNIVAPEDLF